MPSFIRLIAGVIVLVIVEAVVLGFPGITNNLAGTSISAANLAVFFIGLIVCFIILKFGTQFSETVSDAYRSYKNWTPLLAYFFQIIAIAILYSVTNPIAQPYLGTTPWAFPLLFLLIAIIPTLKAVASIVHNFEGPASKQNQN